MSDASDRRCWRLVHHIPVEGIVSGFLHDHAVGSLISLRPAVGGRLHLFRLPVLYRRVITMFVAAATSLTDALPSLIWRMLGRPCYSSSDALPLWLLLVGRPRRMLCRRGAILMDAWLLSCCYRVLVSDSVLAHFV